MTVTCCHVSAAEAPDNDWLWRAVNAPDAIASRNDGKPVVVAIVDDGFRTSHRDLVEFIWRNPLEIPGNGIDDDGNGHVDDVHGWDVSDDDNDIRPPADRLAGYSHGTQLAGLVTQLARRAWGEEAPSMARIMPVKAMSDMADRPYVREGFAGIRYAMEAGADIIITAWGVNQVTREEGRILDEAEDRGVLIVASAGNLEQELEQYPAAHRSVVAVTALGRDGRKIEKAAYGQFVDIAAPGTDIVSAGAVSDSAYETLEGTSYAAAITGGAAALVRARNPGYSAVQVDACLKSSADPLHDAPVELSGKLGAGALNIGAAIDCALLREPGRRESALSATKGYLHLRAAPGESAEWLIEPAGEFKGIRFWPAPGEREAMRGTLRLYPAHAAGNDRPAAAHTLAALPDTLFVAGGSARVALQPEADAPAGPVLLEYEVETIDFSKRYCSGTQRVDAEGVIEDGSGLNDYAPASDCKWLITAPPGQVVHFRFLEFDTEAYTDHIYFFNGAGTHEDIMAGFSGPDIPPELTTWGNQVLMWFVTNREIEGKGWKAEVTFRARTP